jgi:hypothetical protein
VGVDFCCFASLVAVQFMDKTKVSSTFKQKGGVAVLQPVSTFMPALVNACLKTCCKLRSS